MSNEYREKLARWERLANQNGGHNKVVAVLRKIVELRGQQGYPKPLKLDDKLRSELSIASEHGRKTKKDIVVYEPDLIITLGLKAEDRIFIEYVNTEGRYSRCLRNMLALECVMRARGLKAKGFVLALRDNLAKNHLTGVPGNKSKLDNLPESMLDIMPLSLLVPRLEGNRPWDFV